MGTYTLSIMGECHYQDAIWHCRKGDRVILIREPKNPHDENAVAVFREDGEQIGYLPRDNAEWVARVIDGGKKVEAKIKWITGGTRDKPFRRRGYRRRYDPRVPRNGESGNWRVLEKSIRERPIDPSLHLHP